MSAERLAIGDRVRCPKCGRWHPADLESSGSATDYAERMLYIRCGQSLFYVGQVGGTARDPNSVKSPLELELSRVRSHDRIMSCELRCDAHGWEVLLRSDGEPLFSRRCESEDHARYCADGMKQDELKGGGIDVTRA
jgi:hypothetical protein